MAAYEKAFAGEAGLPRGPPPWHAMSGRGFAGEAGLPRGPPTWRAMSGRRLEVTLGRRRAAIRPTCLQRLPIDIALSISLLRLTRAGAHRLCHTVSRDCHQ